MKRMLSLCAAALCLILALTPTALAAGAGVGGALLVKHRRENADEEETEE